VVLLLSSVFLYLLLVLMIAVVVTAVVAVALVLFAKVMNEIDGPVLVGEGDEMGCC